MVLDTVKNPNGKRPKFIFKNTYDDEETGRCRKITMDASHPNAPDVFYYVHFDVDLNFQREKDALFASEQEANELFKYDEEIPTIFPRTVAEILAGESFFPW